MAPGCSSPSSAFDEMSSDVEALADVIESALAADHNQVYSTSAAEAKGLREQRIRTAWAHLLDRRRDLIVHGPRITRSAGWEFDDEEQQRHDDHHYHCSEQFHACTSD